jgi:hypothetical protein
MAVALPPAAIVSSGNAFAAQKAGAKTKKKTAKKYKKKPSSTM